MENDTYICANNQVLEYNGTSTTTTDDEYKIIKKIYQAKSCSNCPLRKECMPKATKEDTNKQISFSEVFDIQKKQALKNITTDEGIKFRINRSIQSEGFFGVLKQDYNFKRFMLRGTQNVQLEMLLLCFACNARKLHSKKVKNLIGKFTEYTIKDKKTEELKAIGNKESFDLQIQMVM